MIHSSNCLVVPPGFEPGSWHPECHMMDRYTKGLATRRVGSYISTKPLDILSTQFLKRGKIDSVLSEQPYLALIHPQIDLLKECQ